MQLKNISSYLAILHHLNDTSKYINTNHRDFINYFLVAEQKELAKQCGDQWVDTDRLFVNWCGEPLHPNIPYKWLQRFCEAEKIPFKGLHSFRHFTATHALANGIDVKKVSDMFGHSQTSTTMNTYIHSVQQANEDACNCIANLLEAS